MTDTTSVPEQPRQEFLPAEESPIQADEKAYESLPESKDDFLENETPVTPITKRIENQPVVAATNPPAIPKDEIATQVEKILEEGLGELYTSLPENAKPKFKEKGELAAIEISVMVRNLKLKAKRALQLIRDWLLTIPGVNRFFLEQEAKIKVDKLNELIEAQKQDLNKNP